MPHACLASSASRWPTRAPSIHLTSGRAWLRPLIPSHQPPRLDASVPSSAPHHASADPAMAKAQPLTDSSERSAAENLEEGAWGDPEDTSLRHRGLSRHLRSGLVSAGSSQVAPRGRYRVRSSGDLRCLSPAGLGGRSTDPRRAGSSRCDPPSEAERRRIQGSTAEARYGPLIILSTEPRPRHRQADKAHDIGQPNLCFPTTPFMRCQLTFGAADAP